MSVIKQPAEKRIYEWDFSPLLGGETIAAILSITPEAKGLVTEVTPLTNADDGHDGSTVRTMLSGGTNGETYLVTARVRDTADQEHELDGELCVIDLSFTLPATAPSLYLTALEYVDRFGIGETVQLTDEKGTRTVDAARLGAALSDATAYAEAAISARYAVPLTVVPPLLKTIVADLVRERLHGDHATTVVAERAKQARADLRDIAKGVLQLPIAGGTVTAPAAGGGLSYATGTAVFTDDALAGF